MKRFLVAIRPLVDRIAMLALWIAGTGLVLMTAVVAYQVFGRYVLNRTPTWAEAGSIELMSWFIFLGAAVGVRERTHLGFDVLLYVLPKRFKIVLRMISDLAVIAFGAGMVGFGLQLVIGTWSGTKPTLGIPAGMSYLPIVAGGSLVVLFTLYRILERLSGLRPDDILDGYTHSTAADDISATKA
ncbi:TRAP transporter small permease [Arsenicitalea aurantiaca]|uniref:TRAP transporter small permease protein n=1 Tax=Arsenicitalea aurantiaca TaxID=1783274 RepID=A0A433X7L7_9HYPH|nr:TRAP transporter small permease [Arsenicitalea aurantiaca]RUT30064.1 TRAP transporter small permease [Arsenicitalea aurantiaca]